MSFTGLFFFNMVSNKLIIASVSDYWWLDSNCKSLGWAMFATSKNVVIYSLSYSWTSGNDLTTNEAPPKKNTKIILAKIICRTNLLTFKWKNVAAYFWVMAITKKYAKICVWRSHREGREEMSENDRREVIKRYRNRNTER